MATPRTACLGLLLAASLIGACGGSGSSAIEVAPVSTTVAPRPTLTEPPETTVNPRRQPELEVTLPVVAPIALPDLTELNATGDLVADSLGSLAAATTGLDVIGSTCAAEGGELAYSGETPSGLFDSAPDGSGTYYRETATDLVTLEVTGSGTGEYYNRSSDGLLTIVAGDAGAGEYYNDRMGQLTTVKIDSEGGGEYYHEEGESLVTISIDADGKGEFYSKGPDGLVTLLALPDGSGEVFDDRNGLEALDLDANGAWKYVRDDGSGRIEINVAADGSGVARRLGENPVEIELERGGLAIGRRFDLPTPEPFLVADRFPPLGTLSTLSPICATVIRFDSRVLFDFDSASLRPEAGPVLDEVVATLRDLGRAVEVNGHTDSRGTDQYNLELSQERADAVWNALVERGLDIPAAVTGLGESQPLVPNERPDGSDDEVGRQQNRRVEIVIPES